ncbi:MAG: hypothetical protein IKX63_06340 [Muribaculaceae bacterium]|nr:hypothetical protein [Muribaculaceae bacterium]
MKKTTALIFLVIALAACTGKQQPQTVYGSWQMCENQNYRYGPSSSTPLTWTFNEDGTFAVSFVAPDITGISQNVDTVNMPGTYAMEGDKMVMSFDSLDLSHYQKEASKVEGYTVTFKVNLSGSNLELMEGNGGITKLKRI